MEELIRDFSHAITRLEEALKEEKTEMIRDSAILRFQLCFDLAWKAIKAYAKSQGLECYSPKNCFKTAFQMDLITYDNQWLEMIADRNLITHTYEEQTAENVYAHLSNYLSLFQTLQTKFSQEA